MASADRARTYGQWWDWHGEYQRVAIDELRDLCEALYRAAGASAADAAFLVEGSIEKTLQGDHARGVIYIPPVVRGAIAGRQDLAATITVVQQRAATGVVDGGAKAVGRLVCRDGMQFAIERARDYGIGLAAARGGAGLLMQFVQMAVDADMVGIVMTQTGPCVAPIGGYTALLGNGPFAVGVPAGEHDPVILDMSFTQTSASGVLLAAEQDETLRPGLLLDVEGNPTTDPRMFREIDRAKSPTDAKGMGTLTPLGNSHKGFAMLFIIGLLSSMLTDTSPPWDLAAGDRRGSAGTILIAIDPAALGVATAPQLVDAFIDTVIGAPRKPGVDEILYPGQRSQQLRRERLARGTIDVPAPHIAALAALAHELDLAVPTSLLPQS